VSGTLADREISIGDYVLSGGELARRVMVDTITRLIPAVGNLGLPPRQDSFTSRAERGSDGEGQVPPVRQVAYWDYPHYTRPAEFRGLAVPKVLSTATRRDPPLARRTGSWRKPCATVRLAGREALSEEDRKLLAEVEKQQTTIGRCAAAQE